MLKLLSLSVLAVLLMGCSTPRSLVVMPEFQQAEYDALSKTGSGGVKGQAFMKTKGGEFKEAGGDTVTLRPKTEYARKLAMLPASLYKCQVVSTVSLKFCDYDRTAMTDSEGRFEFTEVPDGTYYVTTNVSWLAYYPGTFPSVESKQGGTIPMEVTVADSKVSTIMLTR
ncbi:carboxypeptidase-like regulatory domain-containing protein [Janthinobacterium sp. 64]|uniref:carboxypeptidase-like regulatory domain-containing protein n=1 Tax=Janthinobacterium sp. 64 TaxID=2035208 RepID=UPI000CC52E22|nr:carboxypeptidase-like regulatory domain-containing protein [Janthinobacterium sp. 64]PKB22061.1 hypothetical protein CLU91_2449 [Janthinobacterium sp. 64]